MDSRHLSRTPTIGREIIHCLGNHKLATAAAAAPTATEKTFPARSIFGSLVRVGNPLCGSQTRTFVDGQSRQYYSELWSRGRFVGIPFCGLVCVVDVDVDMEIVRQVHWMTISTSTLRLSVILKALTE